MTESPILSAIGALRASDDQVIEVRALHVPCRTKPMTVSGYFNDYDKLAKSVAKLEDRKPEGIYITLNPVNPALLARSANRLTEYATMTTADTDIVRRVWLGIDMDPIRPRGISSSDEELELAAAVRDSVRARMRGWFDREPALTACSGNGWHLLYRIDLSADKEDGEIIKSVLLELAKHENTTRVNVDCSVFNPARIWKLYGTTARKGDPLPDRPHRMAAILEQQETEIIPREALARFLLPAKPAPKTSKTRRGIAETPDTLAQYLTSKGVPIKTTKTSGDATILILDGCPMTPDHGHETDTAVVWRPDGIGFECKHNRCQEFTWKDLRDKIDPDHGQAPETPQLGGWTPNLGAMPDTRPDAEKKNPIVRVANFYTESGDEDEKTIYSVPIETITQNLSEATGGWPRRVSGMLFVPEPNGVRVLSDTDELFAWMQLDASYHWQVLRGKKTARDPRTRASCSLVTRPEFFEHLKARAMPNYSAYEKLPHYPEVDNIYYVPKQLPTGGTDCLKEFIARLNAETEEDRALMLAALLTPAWGGPCGARPAFLFGSKHGRGVGKSKTAEIIMSVFGGWISISADKSDWKEVKQRMLDDSALSVRCVYMDNIRARLHGSDIESLITSPVIDGKRMYVGQFSRPNRLTFFLTSNTPRLSQDLADRCVPIYIGPPKHGADYEKWAYSWVPEHIDQLLADIFFALRSDNQCEISPENRDRWYPWQGDILCKYPNGDKLAALIKARRPEADADRDDADDILYALMKECNLVGVDPNTELLRISNEDMYALLRKYELCEHNFGKRQAMSWLGNLVGSGPLAALRKNPGREFGRGWLFGPYMNNPKSIEFKPIIDSRTDGTMRTFHRPT